MCNNGLVYRGAPASDSLSALLCSWRAINRRLLLHSSSTQNIQSSPSLLNYVVQAVQQLIRRKCAAYWRCWDVPMTLRGRESACSSSRAGSSTVAPTGAGCTRSATATSPTSASPSSTRPPVTSRSTTKTSPSLSRYVYNLLHVSTSANMLPVLLC